MSRRTCRLAALAALAATAACAAPYERPSAEFAPSYAPQPAADARPTGAIYQPGRFASLVEDNRARRVGDVLTIALVENMQAAKSASSNSSRDSDPSLPLPHAAPFSYVPKELLSAGSGDRKSGVRGEREYGQVG